MKKGLKVAIINKSDSTGGAAVVSFRLMEALRRVGVDARMVVVEKLTDSPYVSLASTPGRIKIPFLAERLKIFIANGFRRSTLFKVDTASDGLDLLKNPVVAAADVVCLNWVNQGMLSLDGVRRLRESGKKIVWTMHDMWCFTGICHHAGSCDEYERECADCPLLEGGIFKRLARSVHRKKKHVYRASDIEFVAVSRWLAERGARSSLFEGKAPTVIPNPFHFDSKDYKPGNDKNKADENREFKILFGAARLDDTVKGLPILVRATEVLKERYPEISSRLHLITFGVARDPESLNGIAIRHTHLGRVNGSEAVRKLYEDSDIVVSTSLYETLPGTLVEGQAYGCVPVAFARGGQPDIIDHLSTGYLASWSDSPDEAASNIAKGLLWAVSAVESENEEIRRRMHKSVYERFNEERVAQAYIDIFEKILK